MKLRQMNRITEVSNEMPLTIFLGTVNDEIVKVTPDEIWVR